MGGDLEAGIIRCLDREIGTRVGGGKSGRGEGDEDQCVREQWSSRRQVVKRLEPGGRHQRLAPDIGTRRTAPDIGTRRSAPDIGNRRLAPEIGTRRLVPGDRHQRSAPEIGTRRREVLTMRLLLSLLLPIAALAAPDFSSNLVTSFTISHHICVTCSPASNSVLLCFG